jgi:hypothetical protein
LTWPGAEVIAKAGSPIDYFTVAAHLLGGGFFVDRLLFWKQTCAKVVFSQHQRWQGGDAAAFKKAAVASFVSCGGLEYANAKDLQKTLSAHFAPAQVYQLLISQSELRRFIAQP